MVQGITRTALGSDGSTSVQVSRLWFPGGCNIWPRAQGLTSIMARDNWNSGRIFAASGVYWSRNKVTKISMCVCLEGNSVISVSFVNFMEG